MYSEQITNYAQIMHTLNDYAICAHNETLIICKNMQSQYPGWTNKCTEVYCSIIFVILVKKVAVMKYDNVF